MTIQERLAGLSDSDKVAYLERLHRRLIVYHNNQVAGMTPLEKRVFYRDIFLPRMTRLMTWLTNARDHLGTLTTYDGQIDLTEL